MDRNHSAARAVGISVVVAVVVGLLIAWFAWPSSRLGPRELPVVVAGPVPAASAVAAKLASVRAGAFEVTTVADEAAADQALRDRDAYAAIVIGAGGVSLHIASAASPTVAALITAAAQELGGGQPVTVTDVVPGGADDPRGAGFASGFLPLVLAGMVAGLLLAVVVSGAGARLLGLGLAALLVGCVGAGVLLWLGVISGSYLAAAGAIALVTLAVSSTVTGLGAVLGRAGIALGVLLVFLFANPISAVAAAPELLPEPWGAVGQLLPPGAGATLLRSAVFFDGAGSARPLWTLLGWSVVGLLLAAVGRRRIALLPSAVAESPAEATVAA